MTVEGTRVSETREANVPPVDAVDVLSDNQWHMAITYASRFSADNYDPISLQVFGAVDAPLHARDEFADDEPLFSAEFLRDQGSWGREGSTLGCRGIVRASGKEIPTQLLVWDEAGGTGLFLHSITDTPQSNRR